MAKSIHFKQYDSRWSSKKYPSWGTGTYKYCGCGPTTVATIVSSKDSSITPKKVGDYISKQKNGATKGGASYWSTGVLAALKHYGFIVKAYSKVADCFNALYDAKNKKEDMYGIFDVYGSKGNVTWTSGGGHYIPITDIKKSGDDWLVYVKDPSLRNNSGWFSYKKQLQGHIKLCATARYSSVVTQKAEEPKQITPVESKSISSKNVKFAHSTSSGDVGCKLRDWYDMNPLFIMRPKDSDLAEKIAKIAVEATKHTNIKYAKDHKKHSNNLATALSKVGWDMSKVTETCYTVCTDFQMCCVLASSPEIRKGIKDYGSWAWAGHVGVESKLTATGRFTKITDKDTMNKGVGLKKGDLIVSKTHGVVVVEVEPTQKEEPTKADSIVAKCKELAWAYKTAKKTTVEKPKDAYKKALDRTFPKHNDYKNNYKTGKTCDMFVAVVMRDTGIAKDYPRYRGLGWKEKDAQGLYLSNSEVFKEVKASECKPGDIIIYSRDDEGKKGHTCIVLSDGFIAEASAGDFYPRITKSLSTRLSMKDKKKLKVYRAV